MFNLFLRQYQKSSQPWSAVLLEQQDIIQLSLQRMYACRPSHKYPYILGVNYQKFPGCLENASIFRKLMDIQKYSELFWLSPLFFSLFSPILSSMPGTIQLRDFPLKIFIPNHLKAFKQQFSKMADAGNIELLESSSSVPTTARKFWLK